jgi:8-oxo-dGTP diphosphatase
MFLRHRKGSKFVGAGALIFDDDGRFLVIKHRWRDAWEYPAGAADGIETPLDAAQREVQEEVGLKPTDFKFIGVDQVQSYAPNGNLIFTFSARVKNSQAHEVKLDLFEATEHRWVTREEALSLTSGDYNTRLRALFQACDTGTPVYLEFGRPGKG